MNLAIQTALNSISTAGLYALVAVGFVLIYRASGVLNFAQGEFALLGGYIFVSATGWVAGSFILAAMLLIPIMFVIGVVVYRLALRRLLARGPLTLVLATIALSSLVEAICLIHWGSATIYPKTPWSIKSLHFSRSLVTSPLDIATIVGAVIVIGVLSLALQRTRLGIGMRATAENPLLASLRGLRVTAYISTAWGLALICAAIAGVLFGARGGLTPTDSALGFAAFPAVLIGGFDSIPGSLIGSVILALANGYVSTYVGGQYSIVAGYVLVLIVLVTRPSGLLGQRRVERI